ncbi:phospholipid/cholesterol/gamma-HCH transport system substrate-binding protein [Herbihabitans rhizosphaerae]|uniref:Phospholipid/cholesterol/gamma-HCH transport system substrate-binding protein n=1 Tax=Herbihabitans rhizosphaerae TaxID=1872711 RepID=A0A4Q7KLR9_9PSEU|nr:MCE family protein [Herbihabitans rhizosphaerae]RZS37204.1 phospholipid/cholesterol/gamma-HCH transport system substrate-binding protein [Herbihabitans rhizosphaerae]
MKSFQSRNPIPIGIVSLMVIGLMVTTAVFFDDLPVVGGGTTYSAEFSEAAGLQTDDEVRVAGVKVGKVKSIDLDGDRVVVKFKVKDAWIGDRTKADIKIKTLLGQKLLSLEPAGNEALDAGSRIPKERTTAPYDVLEAFRGLADTVNTIDTNQLARSFEVISQTFANTPEEIKAALTGLQGLSQTISSRDQALGQLLNNTKQISKTLADRDKEVLKLIGDGNLLLGEITKRRQAISTLLTGTQTLSRELQGLVKDNEQQLGPVLTSLDKLSTMLQRNEGNLAQGLIKFAPFARLFNNAIGTGRWFDNYICAVLPPSLGPINQEGCLAK